jgi:hypothetical protein
MLSSTNNDKIAVSSVRFTRNLDSDGAEWRSDGHILATHLTAAAAVMGSTGICVTCKDDCREAMVCIALSWLFPAGEMEAPKPESASSSINAASIMLYDMFTVFAI